MDSSFAEVLAHISRDEIAKTALELVRIPSPTRQELEAQDLYAQILRDAGMQVELRPVEAERSNVVGRIPGVGKSGHNLMLCGHIDTIPLGSCTAAKIENGRVFGRGACDMKGSLAAFAVAAKAIKRSGFRMRNDLFVAAYCGHEAPEGKSEGAIKLASDISERRLEVNAAVVGEGPLDSIGIAHGGMAIFKVTIQGPTGSPHTTMVPITSNPILSLGNVIEELGRMDRELNARDWNHLIPQRPSIQLGIVRGGDFYNRLPASCELTGTIRWDPDETVTDVAERLRARLGKVEQRIWSEYDSQIRLQVEVDLTREACEVPESNSFVQLALEIASSVTGNHYRVSGWRQVYDLSTFYGIGGIPAIGLGPILGSDSTSHSDNESVSIDNLEIMTKIYAALTLKYCQAIVS